MTRKELALLKFFGINIVSFTDNDGTACSRMLPTAAVNHLLGKYDSKNLIPQDKIRTQTQVYLTSPFKGW